MRARSKEQSLARAFESFTHAAGSLENSYARLQVEVMRLRRELEQTNRDLARSLEENGRMRTKLARILEGLPCGVLVFDSEGRLRMANAQAHRLLGIAPRFALEKATEEGPEPFWGLLKHLPEEGAGGEQTWPVEGPEGMRHLGITRALLPDGPASSCESIFILRDMTAEKRLEQEREAARRIQALAEMSALLAHEIRNPLGSLELFAGLLADATENQNELRQWAEHLQAGLRMLSATVNNVLQFHSQPPLQLIPLPLGRLLRETTEFLRPLARQGGMRIEFSLNMGEVTLAADSQRLQQVFFNLALNAFHSMSPGGRLWVSGTWARQGESEGVQVEFADTGAGIALDHLERIFEPGFTTRPGSPGLGLAVCRKIVEQHGGVIWAQSVPGQGTVFTLYFPVARARA